MFRAPQELGHLKSSTRGSVISVHILLLKNRYSLKQLKKIGQLMISQF